MSTLPETHPVELSIRSPTGTIIHTKNILAKDLDNMEITQNYNNILLGLDEEFRSKCHLEINIQIPGDQVVRNLRIWMETQNLNR